jgi:hypothetical protein
MGPKMVHLYIYSFIVVTKKRSNANSVEKALLYNIKFYEKEKKLRN